MPKELAEWSRPVFGCTHYPNGKVANNAPSCTVIDYNYVVSLICKAPGAAPQKSDHATIAAAKITGKEWVDAWKS